MYITILCASLSMISLTPTVESFSGRKTGITNHLLHWLHHLNHMPLHHCSLLSCHGVRAMSIYTSFVTAYQSNDNWLGVCVCGVNPVTDWNAGSCSMALLAFVLLFVQCCVFLSSMHA